MSRPKLKIEKHLRHQRQLQYDRIFDDLQDGAHLVVSIPALTDLAIEEREVALAALERELDKLRRRGCSVSIEERAS